MQHTNSAVNSVVRPLRSRRSAVVLGIVALSASLVSTMAFTSNATLAPPAWLSGLTAPHRQLFDAPTSGGGVPLVHVMNYYDTYNNTFTVKDKDINGVLTFYGATTFYGLSDSMWKKYRLGEFLGEKDATGAPFTENPWRVKPVVLGMSLPQASIASLRKRGVTFILCNNALSIFSGLVAQARGLDAKSVYDDMKSNILPQATLVPAMVIAIEQAQKAGLTYHRQ